MRCPRCIGGVILVDGACLLCSYDPEQAAARLESEAIAATETRRGATPRRDGTAYEKMQATEARYRARQLEMRL